MSNMLRNNGSGDGPNISSQANDSLKEFMRTHPGATQNELIEFLANNKFFDAENAESPSPAQQLNGDDIHVKLEIGAEEEVGGDDEEDDIANNNHDKEHDKDILERRGRDLQRGKATPSYLKYTEHVPREMRLQNHPRTPDREVKCTRKKWDNKIRTWRKSLYSWYKVKPTTNDKEDSDRVDLYKNLLKLTLNDEDPYNAKKQESLKRNKDKESSTSPVANKQVNYDPNNTSDPEFEILFPNGGNRTVFQVDRKQSDFVKVPGKQMSLSAFIENPMKLQILHIFKKVVADVMRDFINVGYPFEQNTKEKIVKAAAAINRECSTTHFRTACQYALGTNYIVPFSTLEIVRIMYGLTKDEGFRRSQGQILKHNTKMGPTWKDAKWGNFRIYRTRLFDHLNSQLVKQKHLNDDCKVTKNVKDIVIKFETKLDLWFPQFTGETPVLFKIYLWAIQCEKKYLGKLTPESDTKLRLPPSIKGDEMNFGQKEELWAWFADVFTVNPIHMSVADTLDILSAMVKTMKKDQIRRRILDWWTAGYYYNKYVKGGASGKGAANGKPAMKKPIPIGLLGQVRGRRGGFPRMRGGRPPVYNGNGYEGYDDGYYPPYAAARGMMTRGRMMGMRRGVGMMRGMRRGRAMYGQMYPDYY